MVLYFLLACCGVILAALRPVPWRLPRIGVYLAIFAAVFIVSFLWLDPDLARERIRPGGKRPPIALQLISAVLVSHWIIAGLDHGRFHWSDTVPSWLQWLSLLALAASYGLCLWAMHVNRFFSSVIRIQNDRGQVVITTGPYAYIRHLGYLAGTLVMLASGPCSSIPWLASPAFLRDLHSAVSILPRHRRGSRAADAAARLPRLRGPGPLAAGAGTLVRRRNRRLFEPRDPDTGFARNRPKVSAGTTGTLRCKNPELPMSALGH